MYNLLHLRELRGSVRAGLALKFLHLGGLPTEKLHFSSSHCVGAPTFPVGKTACNSVHTAQCKAKLKLIFLLHTRFL